jgi:hypothetical protein
MLARGLARLGLVSVPGAAPTMVALTITITGDTHIGMRMTRTMNTNGIIATGGGDL